MASRAASSPDVDHVIGAFHRAELSAALAATHRSGFGPQTLVFDGARGDVGRQFVRAGINPIDSEPAPLDTVLIVVSAPGRTAIVADLFTRLGAESVSFAARFGADRYVADTNAALAPDIRIADDPAAPSEI